MNKTTTVLTILLLSAGMAHAQQGKVQVTAFGGINHLLEYGSVDDFEAGYNNFPVVPAHSPGNFGAALSYSPLSWLGIEYDMRMSLRTDVTLTDPSDGDTLTIQTPKHFAISLSLLLQPFQGRISPYLLIGGGVDRIIAEDEAYISEMGYEIVMPAPPEDERVDTLLQAGAGINVLMYRSFGIRLDVRYMRIFDEPRSVGSVMATLGLIARF